MAAIDLSEKLKGMEGRWIAFDDDYSVISHGEVLVQVVCEAKEKGYPDPILFRCPEHWRTLYFNTSLSWRYNMIPMPLSAWDDNTIQFARLLDELQAVGVVNLLKKKEWQALMASMDLTKEDILEIWDRATDVYDQIKTTLLCKK